MSEKVRTQTVVTSVVFALIASVVYFINQQGQVKLGRGDVGIIMVRGGYRSWIWSFNDGYCFASDGKWRSFYFNESDTNAVMHFGYRLIPKYRHTRYP